MEEVKQNFNSSVDDELCVRGAVIAEMAELLNDGQSQIFKEIPIENSTIQRPQLQQFFVNNQPPAESSNDLKWSAAVKASIEHTYATKSFAKTFLLDRFFAFENWPPYMVELFILNNVAMYSYSDRNKICLFFWGNGATLEDMFTLSEFFAPSTRHLNHEQKSKYNESKRKCIGLFKTYGEQKYNPSYAQRYYFYSMYERRMLFIDSTPRHYGRRQSRV